MKYQKTLVALGTFLSDCFTGKDNKVYRSFLTNLIKYLDFLEGFSKKVVKASAYKSSLQEEFDKANDNIIYSAYLLEKTIALPSTQKTIRDLFRNICGKYIFQSQIIKYSYEKPRGYPGDYFVFEQVYNNRPLSQGIGYYFDKYALKYLLSIGVRERKDIAKDFLKKYISNTSVNNIEIMNLGCGSCREIKELLNENTIHKKVTFTCIDQDDKAITFAKNSLHKSPSNIKFNFLIKDIVGLTRVDRDKVAQPFNTKKDIIYALGLCDYFLDAVLENFIKFYYSLLKRNGRLIIAFCSSKKPLLYTHLRWFCEWSFLPRYPQYIRQFIKKGLHIHKVKVVQNPSRTVFFTIIKK